MGFFKKLGKFAKKAVKIAKPLAGIALTAATGGTAAPALLGGMKLLSKLKSAGSIVKASQIATPRVQAMINRSSIPTVQPRAIAGSGAPIRSSRVAASPAVRRRAVAKRKGPSKTQLKALYQEWIAEGRPGDWQDYARSQL